jgi:hypothetical protein
MTEDEAKTKVCCGPLGIASTIALKGAPATAENEAMAERSGLCLASACMAWRWAGYRAKDGTWVRKTAGGPWKPEIADGFCGLAGAPQ